MRGISQALADSCSFARFVAKPSLSPCLGVPATRRLPFTHTFFLQIFQDSRHNSLCRKRQDCAMKKLMLLGCVLPIVLPIAALEIPFFFQQAGPVDRVQQSTSQDTTVAAAAQKHLREAGPSGLRMLLERYASQIAAHRGGAPSDEQWKRIASALDKVGGQHDNYASQLYWYTDLEQAKAAARVSGRPILSLRLLGRLDEDLSCANSRFFRTTLYPDTQINQILKDQYILHWESVRPAPRVTINFGDGRMLERTITGNSIHYILDSNGQIVDALPGLYSAEVFARELRAAADASQGEGDKTAHLEATRTRLLNQWAGDLAALHVSLPARPWREDDLEARTNEATWQQIAQLHPAGARIDANVRELMLRKFPSAQFAARLAETKSVVEVPILRNTENLGQANLPGGNALAPPFPTAQVAARVSLSKSMVETPMLRSFDSSPRVLSLRRTVALDTVENDYTRRTRILAFVASQARAHKLSLAAINDWVYGQVFLTPREDPWLGLATGDVFSAIDGDGRTH